MPSGYRRLAVTLLLNIWMLCAIYNLVSGIFNISGDRWTVQSMDAVTGL